MIKAAGKSVGARISKGLVIVTQAQRPIMKGMAISCLLYKPKQKWIVLDGGYIRVMLPKLTTYYKSSCYNYDSNKLARKFFALCQHEWAHILDYQRGRYSATPTHPSGRQINWKDRPAEIRAKNMVADAKMVPNQNELIQKLATWIEMQCPDSDY